MNRVPLVTVVLRVMLVCLKHNTSIECIKSVLVGLEVPCICPFLGGGK